MNQEVVETGFEDTEEAGRPFLPNHIVEEIGVIFLVTGIIMIIASLLRPEEVGLPHLFFAGAHEMADLVAPWFAGLVILLVVIFLLALPFLDRSEEKHPKKRLVFVIIMLDIILVWLIFTILGF
jgi:quinol-cytochrome oxidoreductase complex cytochrome b subunit